MAYTGNILEGHTLSPIAVAADGYGKQRPRPNVFLQCSSTTQKDDVESWGKPRMPLRPPFYVPPDLAREQLKGHWERRGFCIPVDSWRALKHPYGPPPAIAEESLTTAEVNSSEWLAGWRQMEQDSINVSQKFSGGPPSSMIEETMVSNEGTKRGVNNAKFHVALPQGQGLFPPRGTQIRGTLPIATIRSGIMMELPPGNMRMAGNERLAHVSFPLGGPWYPMENWTRPITMTPSIAHLSWCPSGPCFISPGPLISNSFLNMPMSFAPLPVYHPPLPSYFANFSASNMPPPISSNRKNK